MLLYIPVQTMYITRTCLLCTISHFNEHEIKKLKFACSGFEPKAVCMQERCHILCTASVVVRESKVTVYYSCFTWRLVTYTGPAATPAPAMTSPARRRDLCKAEVCCPGEASIGGADLAAHWHSSPIEKQPSAT
jgi:hypothetical protein